jgi:hypothetical protein
VVPQNPRTRGSRVPIAQSRRRCEEIGSKAKGFEDWGCRWKHTVASVLRNLSPSFRIVIDVSNPKIKISSLNDVLTSLLPVERCVVAEKRGDNITYNENQVGC